MTKQEFLDYLQIQQNEIEDGVSLYEVNDDLEDANFLGRINNIIKNRTGKYYDELKNEISEIKTHSEKNLDINEETVLTNDVFIDYLKKLPEGASSGYSIHDVDDNIVDPKFLMNVLKTAGKKDGEYFESLTTEIYQIIKGLDISSINQYIFEGISLNKHLGDARQEELMKRLFETELGKKVQQLHRDFPNWDKIKDFKKFNSEEFNKFEKQVLVPKYKEIVLKGILDVTNKLNIEKLTWGTFKKLFPSLESNEYIKNIFTSNNNIISNEQFKQMSEEASEAEKKYELGYDAWTDLHGQNIFKATLFTVQLNMTKEEWLKLLHNDVLSMFWQGVWYSQMYHPTKPQTVGWMRVYYDKEQNAWVIVEIQSDLYQMLLGFSDIQQKQMDKFDAYMEHTFGEKKMDYILNYIKVHFKDWEQMLLGSIIKLAHKNGIEKLYLLSSADVHKVSDVSQKIADIYYKNLPKQFGFKKEDIKINNKDLSAWKIPIFAKVKQ